MLKPHVEMFLEVLPAIQIFTARLISFSPASTTYRRPHGAAEHGDCLEAAGERVIVSAEEER